MCPSYTPAFISQCLEIKEKVSLNIASEARYIYILSGQKFIKNGPIWLVFENCGQTVLPEMSILIAQKMVKNAISEN